MARQTGTTHTRRRQCPASFIERLMARALRRHKIAFQPQYPVRRAPPYHRRFYYLDFALVDQMLAIETDGARYHTSKRQIAHDLRRQRAIEKMGWTFRRFTGSQIVTDIDACVQDILAAIKGL